MFEQQKRGRAKRENLPAQFRADRSAGARDHHCLAFDTAFEQVWLRRYRVATQQVGDIHFLDVFDLYPAAGQIGEVRVRFGCEAGNASRKSRISRRRARVDDGSARRISCAPVSSIICWMCLGL